MTSTSAVPGRAASRLLRFGGAALSALLTVIATFVVTTLGWLLMWTLAPKAVGWDTVVIMSGSMEPRLRIGDAVVIEPGTARLAPGYLVTFHDPAQPGRVLTHRLVRFNEAGELVTKGDANRRADTLTVKRSAVIGTARAIIPMGGMPKYWHSSKQFVPLVALGSVAFCSLVLLFFTGRRAWEVDDEAVSADRESLVLADVVTPHLAARARAAAELWPEAMESLRVKVPEQRESTNELTAHG